MKFLNYHHLYYFWIVAREGGISHASDALDVSASTISAQIAQLETAQGVQLFDRVGRNLRLSEVGQIAFRYAEEIFALGREMTHAIRQQNQILKQVDRILMLIERRLPR